MTLSILAVEDEALVRMSIAIDLEDAGYHVFEARNAARAETVLEDEAVDLPFTDVDMPGPMDGLTLASLVRRQFPSMPIVITSGHRDMGEVQLPSASEFLSKPYKCAQVIAAFERLARRL